MTTASDKGLSTVQNFNSTIDQLDDDHASLSLNGTYVLRSAQSLGGAQGKTEICPPSSYVNYFG